MSDSYHPTIMDLRCRAADLKEAGQDPKSFKSDLMRLKAQPDDQLTPEQRYRRDTWGPWTDEAQFPRKAVYDAWCKARSDLKEAEKEAKASKLAMSGRPTKQRKTKKEDEW